jgi:hypothetical protein
MVMAVGFEHYNPVLGVLVLCAGAISSGVLMRARPGFLDWVFMVHYSEELQRFRSEPKRVAGIEKHTRFIRVWLPLAEIVVGVVGLVGLMYVSL